MKKQIMHKAGFSKFLDECVACGMTDIAGIVSEYGIFFEDELEAQFESNPQILADLVLSAMFLRVNFATFKDTVLRLITHITRMNLAEKPIPMLSMNRQNLAQVINRVVGVKHLILLAKHTDLRGRLLIAELPVVRITNDLLRELSEYYSIEELDLSYNSDVTSIDCCAKTLKVLIINGIVSKLTDKSLVNLSRLEVLMACSNPNITTVAPFAGTLRALYLDSLGTSAKSGITDAGLVDAHSIVYLCCSGVAGITTVEPFAKSLRYLTALYNEDGLRNEGLRSATKIERLQVTGNPYISDIRPFAASLTTLDANDMSAIDDASLEFARSLKTLNCRGNDKITTIAPFAATLRTLDISDRSGLRNKSLRLSRNLHTLKIAGNAKITKIDTFADSLRVLDARGDCGIGDSALRNAVNLETLFADDNPIITTVAPFAMTLRHLTACGSCGIGDKGLCNARCIEKFESKNNMKITTVAPFADALTFLAAEFCGLCKKSVWPDVFGSHLRRKVFDEVQPMLIRGQLSFERARIDIYNTDSAIIDMFKHACPEFKV